MRAVYRLLGLVRRYGNAPVDTACSRALDLDVVSVTKIASMLERATEDTLPLLPTGTIPGGRFAGQPAEFLDAIGPELTGQRDGEHRWDIAVDVLARGATRRQSRGGAARRPGSWWLSLSFR